MKEKLKTQKGIALVTIVIGIIIAVVVGGAGYLTVRMIITGDDFLAPFEDFMDSDDDDDDGDRKSDKDEDQDEKKDKDDEDEDITTSKDSNLSAKAKAKDVIHYHGEMDFDDYTGGSSLDYSDLIELNADFYATDTEIVEIVFDFNLKEFLQKYYEKYEDDMVSAGFSTYADFRDEMMETFETSFESGFTSSSGSDVSDYFDVYHPEKEIIEMHVTEGGIEKIYENYGIKEGDSVKQILEGFESALNVELEEV